MADVSMDLGDFAPLPQAHIAWIRASEAQKIAITIGNVYKIDANAWEHMNEDEQQDFTTLCWKTAQELQITDRLSFAYFCYYSLCWGLYFYLDPRWGRHKQQMEDVAIPAQLRLEKIFTHISLIEQACHGSDHSRIREIAKDYCVMDLALSLPDKIGDMVRLLEITFRRHWPERLEHLPPHYFENTVIYMKQQCSNLKLYGEWDLLLASALSLIVGRYFFHDPALNWLAGAFFAKDKLIGRDKALKILRIALAVLKKNLTKVYAS